MVFSFMLLLLLSLTMVRYRQLHVGGGRATGLVIGDTAIPFR